MTLTEITAIRKRYLPIRIDTSPGPRIRTEDHRILLGPHNQRHILAFIYSDRLPPRVIEILHLLQHLRMRGSHIVLLPGIRAQIIEFMLADEPPGIPHHRAEPFLLQLLKARVLNHKHPVG